MQDSPALQHLQALVHVRQVQRGCCSRDLIVEGLAGGGKQALGACSPVLGHQVWQPLKRVCCPHFPGCRGIAIL